MQFIPKGIKKFQEGGAMLVEEPVAPETASTEGAPVEEGGQNPMMVLGQAAAQALQSQDCLLAMQVCQGLVEMLQQMGGGAPQEQQGEPVFKKGGVLLRRIKK